MNAILAQADALDELPLAPGRVHCVVTSPPYWGHRDYAGGSRPHGLTQFLPLPEFRNFKALTEPWSGDYGQEATPSDYVGHTISWMRTIRRVLRPDGVAWIVIGDTSAGNNSLYPPPGSRMAIPHRVLLALEADGWIVRMDPVWCLSGGTFLYARTSKSEGPMMLKDLVRLRPDSVELWNGRRWTRVASWTKSGRDRPLEIVLRSGEKVTSSRGHIWPTLRGFLRADELKVGDEIEVATLPEGQEQPAWLIDDAYWFAGLFLAEGTYTADGGLRLSGHRKETTRWLRIQALAQHYGATATLRLSGNSQEIGLDRCEALTAILSHLLRGRTSRDKGLAPYVWQLTNISLARIIHGYLEGDGHYDGSRWRIGFTRNHKLAGDLRCAAARLNCTLTLKQVFSTINGRRYPSFRGEWRWVNRARLPRSTILIIRPSSGGRSLWNVEVEDDPHLFCLASGLLTHNSKPAPMPEPNAGWRWERHRIKVRKAVEDWRKIARARDGIVEGAVAHTAGGNYGFRHKPEWKNCPGCPKCEPHGGLVLRRGSWRHTAAHETILMCVQQMQYWSDSEAAAEPAGDWKAAYSQRTTSRQRGEFNGKTNQMEGREAFRAVTETRNPRSVMTVATSTYPGAHFATYPPDVVRPLALATCPRRVCAICGTGHAPIVERIKHPTRDVEAQRSNDAERTGRTDGHVSGPSGQTDETKVIGYQPACDCPTQEWKPGLLLDPFCGSGTTGEVARELGLDFIGTDLSFEYLHDQARVRVLHAGGRSDDLPLFGGAT